jgi:iron(III) transport system ATP-binding protein
MTSQLVLQQVSVRYGDFAAVRDVSLQLEQGQIGCLLGPSGCGKTTLLRAIAGFEPISSGRIVLHDEIISEPGRQIPPEQRRVGMVFQDFALFPHLDVARNVGFGLSGLTREERQSRVAEMLQLVGLGDHAPSMPHELSGGQQQRVALARALAPRPDILLLDEPFSNLDSELREQLAREVRALLKQHGVTAILVTHDQHEAFAMADHVTLLREGSVAQSDTPYNLYHNPANEFVAGFIGQGAMIALTVDAAGGLGEHFPTLDRAGERWQPGDQLELLIRPDDIEYAAESETRLEVAGKVFRGAHYLYELLLGDGQRVLCIAPSHVDVAEGGMLPVRFDLRHVVVFRRSDGA